MIFQECNLIPKRVILIFQGLKVNLHPIDLYCLGLQHLFDGSVIVFDLLYEIALFFDDVVSEGPFA